MNYLESLVSGDLPPWQEGLLLKVPPHTEQVTQDKVPTADKKRFLRLGGKPFLNLESPALVQLLVDVDAFDPQNLDHLVSALDEEDRLWRGSPLLIAKPEALDGNQLELCSDYQDFYHQTGEDVKAAIRYKILRNLNYNQLRTQALDNHQADDRGFRILSVETDYTARKTTLVIQQVERVSSSPENPGQIKTPTRGYLEWGEGITEGVRVEAEQWLGTVYGDPLTASPDHHIYAPCAGTLTKLSPEDDDAPEIEAGTTIATIV